MNDDGTIWLFLGIIVLAGALCIHFAMEKDAEKADGCEDLAIVTDVLIEMAASGEPWAFRVAEKVRDASIKIGCDP